MEFRLSRIPEIRFGAGDIRTLPSLVSRYGNRVLILTGKSSFRGTEAWNGLLKELYSGKFIVSDEIVSGEPSPELINGIVSKYGKEIDVVVAIGGGSVLDAGKAVSAMLPLQEPVEDYLEDVGTKEHPGTKIPFIAVPTTAGTGSEASKNAVISRIGPGGFKKSLRHDNFIPDAALVDPELMFSCPPAVTAASGLDAFTQLLESYVSIKATPVTDALALDGMRRIGISLLEASSTGSKNILHRSNMAYGALLSGITLANAGLGTVHGMAGPAGGYSTVPHAVFCAATVAEVTKVTISKLNRMGPEADPFLEKYASVGILLSGKKNLPTDPANCELIRILEEWTKKLQIPRLREYGIDKAIIEKIVAASNNKNNPAKLVPADMAAILERAR
jgi:alcohol dehydrogenase class IV